MEDLSNGKRQHKLVLNCRKDCSITGVVDVLSFDVNEILLETEQGMLMIKGNDLHVSRLTLEKGEIDVEGRMDSFSYSEVTSYSKTNEPFLTRLFK